MEHSMYITFKLRKSKINKKGLAPIYMRIAIDGIRTELATHRNISPIIWNDETGYSTGKTDEGIILNLLANLFVQIIILINTFI